MRNKIIIGIIIISVIFLIFIIKKVVDYNKIENCLNIPYDELEEKEKCMKIIGGDK